MKRGLTKVLKSSVVFILGFGTSRETIQSSVYVTKILGLKSSTITRLPTYSDPRKIGGYF